MTEPNTTKLIDEKLLSCLTIPGMSGHEHVIRDFLVSELTNYGEIMFDKLGSVICKIAGTSSSPLKWYISAHIDTCGFIVHSIDQSGKINCVSFGYRDHEACNNQPVAIFTSSGFIDGEMRTSLGGNKKKTYQVDIGSQSAEEARSLGIIPGDPVHFTNEPYLIGKPEEEIICAPRLDNRLGVYELLLLAEALKKDPPLDDIFLVGTVEEEVGARGAQTSAKKIKPDLALILDATYDDGPVTINKGPVITLSDAAVILPNYIRDFLLKVARENNMSIQTEVWNIGQTDAARLRTIDIGVPTIPVLTATKNNHSPHEVGSIKDCRDVVKYVLILLSLGSSLVKLFEYRDSEQKR